MLGAFGSLPFGTSVFGISQEDSIFDTAPAEFGFDLKAQLAGDRITISYDVPSAADSPNWQRRLVILRKMGEYPQSVDDLRAYTLRDETYSDVELSLSIDDYACSPKTIYYYAIFALRSDGYWVCDQVSMRDTAYTFGDSTALADYGYKGLPRGYRTEDRDQHLYQFFQILYSMFRALKVDAEMTLDLVSADYIHADLIPYLDNRLGWPTWLYQGALAQREETKNAIPTYQIKGTTGAFQDALEACSDFTISIVEGWKFVMFSNNKYDSTVPDTTDPDTVALLGSENDIVKYTNSSDSWRSVSGLGVFLYDLVDETDIEAVVVDRMLTLIEFLKASYANYGLNFDMGDVIGGTIVEIGSDWFQDVWV